MKTIKTLTIAFVLVIIVVAKSFAQESNDNSDFNQLSFEVELNKTTYFSLETMFVTFRLINRTQNSVIADRPSFLNDSTLKIINFRGETKEITSMSLSSGRPQKLPGKKPMLQPSQTYEEITVPSITSEIFSDKGKYKLQFFLNGLASNVIEITITDPTGLNKDAFDFFSQYQGRNSFEWIWTEKNGIVLLEEFVSKYGESVYGEQAIYALGNIYKARDEIEKAQNEFEKIKTSDNKLIANQANKSLQDIKTRKMCLEKDKKP